MFHKEKMINELNDILTKEGCEFRAEYKVFYKNNVSMESIVIGDDVHNASTVYYPDGYFWMCGERKRVEILKEIYSEHARDIDMDSVMDKEHLLSNVLPRVVSKTNKENADKEGLAYVEYLDMLVEFFVVLESLGEDCFASYTISLQYLQHLGISVDDIYRRSIANLMSHIRIFNLREFMGGFHNKYDLQVYMYAITNKYGIHGASTILCTDLLMEIGKVLGEPYIIFPSSIHEIIVAPTGYVADLNAALEIVREINETQVELEDRLTDSVYICENGYLSIYN